MRKTIIKYFAVLSLALPVLFSGCTQDDILFEADYNITLDPDNTYIAGDPVVFNISGQIDNLLFYSGETGSEYQFKDRYSIPLDNIDKATLHLEVLAQYGNYNDGMNVYYSNSFSGLARTDASGDRETLAKIDLSTWNEVDLWSAVGDEANGKTGVADIDITDMKENFSLAFHWHPTQGDDKKSAQRTYKVNGKLTVATKDYGTIETDLNEFLFTTVMMNEEIPLDSVYVNSYGNGSIRFDDAANDINFQGVSGGILDYDIDGWCVSVPMDLNSIPNDKGTVVKNLQNYMDSFSYTWNEPGTYKVVFVGRNANYIGSSELVKEMTVTILNKPLDGGNDGDGADETDPETPAE